MMAKAAKGLVVPPSPYSFEETVRRVLQAPPLRKRKKRSLKKNQKTKG